MSKAKTTFYIPSPYREMLTWLTGQEEDRSESYVLRRLIKAEYERRGGPAVPEPSVASGSE